MNPSDVQSDAEPTYFDPEEIDMSEQQFAASLEISAEKQQFEIDEMEGAREETRGLTVAEPAVESLTAVAPGAHVDPVRHVSGAGELQDATDAVNSAPLAPELQADWRNLVSAKVNNYKARKPQKDRYPSLKLQFDPPVHRTVRERETAPVFESPKERVHEPTLAVHSLPILPPDPPPEPQPRIVLEATARVIEFPRPAFPRGDELAEPVIDRPRIVEAPELLPPPPAMGGILMASPQEPEPERRPGFDVPLQSAPLQRRVAAGIFDAMLVAIATALFGYVVFRINGAMPLRSAATLTAGLLAVLWPAYQYAFLVFCAKTPGLRMAKLRLSRFDGGHVSRNLRRWRVLASMLSLASLGLGYAWCFLDEDQLSWHDRITRTHLAP